MLLQVTYCPSRLQCIRLGLATTIGLMEYKFLFPDFGSSWTRWPLDLPWLIRRIIKPLEQVSFSMEILWWLCITKSELSALTQKGTEVSRKAKIRAAVIAAVKACCWSEPQIQLSLLTTFFQFASTANAPPSALLPVARFNLQTNLSRDACMSV